MFPEESSEIRIADPENNSRSEGLKTILQINGRSDLSGGPIAMLRLLQGMNNEPFQHIVVCPNGDGIVEDLKKLINVQTEFLELRQISLSTIIKLYRLLQDKPVDLIHSHGKAAGLYGRFLGRCFGIPVLHQFHGLHYRHYLPGLRGIYLKIEQIMSGWSEKIICVSESECAEAESLRLFSPGKGLVIPNGVDGNKFQKNAEQRESLREQWEIPKNAWVLLSITRASVQKDLEMTLAVHQLLRRETKGEVAACGWAVIEESDDGSGDDIGSEAEAVGGREDRAAALNRLARREADEGRVGSAISHKVKKGHQ